VSDDIIAVDSDIFVEGIIGINLEKRLYVIVRSDAVICDGLCVMDYV
jgi:hypothetical protein